jgi:hypothetical protein
MSLNHRSVSNETLAELAAPLWAWMNERQAIFIKKERGDPWPWTDDPILQTYSFCNAFREQDKVTIWIRKNWREPYADHPNLWFAMCIARFINWPDTLAEIGFPEDIDACGVFWDHMATTMRDRAERKEKVFTGAYLITGGVGEAGDPKWSKVVHDILYPCWTKFHDKNPDALFGRSLELAWSTLVTTPGFGGGGFMAYEVVTDLRWTRYLRDAPDIQTWANPGPGARRGCARILGWENYDRFPRQDALEMIERLTFLANNCGGLMADYMPKIEARDIEHSLCETDKYMRVALNQGRPRALYRRPKEGLF